MGKKKELMSTQEIENSIRKKTTVFFILEWSWDGAYQQDILFVFVCLCGIFTSYNFLLGKFFHPFAL